mmetsp:Transcript_5848/g.10153  ORF Transcript_5848/g.10153 Transcript_5848/m.10153 type:complete len:328 (-) Transcript_5848:19-1002(-)
MEASGSVPSAVLEAPVNEYENINRFFASFKPSSDFRSHSDSHDVPDGKLTLSSDGSYISALMEPPFHSSHASNLLFTPDGTLHLVWFNGASEGGAGNAIVLSSLVAGGARWSRPIVVSKDADRSAQNPVLFYDDSRSSLTLLHTSQQAYKGQATSEVRAVHSLDCGKTWSTPQTVLTAAGAFTKNQLLRCAKGSDWLLPMYYTPDGFFEHHSQYSTVQRSTDGGLSWVDSTPMDGTWGKLVQPTVVRGMGGGLICFFRSRAADFVYKSHSDDDGHTWSHAERTELPNNNSGIQAAVLLSGALVLVFNNWRGKSARWPLSIALSEDGE